MNLYLAKLDELGDEVSYLCNRLSRIPNVDGVNGCSLRNENGEVIAMLVRPEMFLAFSNLIAGMITDGLDPVKVLSRQLDRFTLARNGKMANDNGSGMTNNGVREYLKGHIEATLELAGKP